VATAPGAPFVVLEGHNRLTARLLRPEVLPTELDLLCGYSRALGGWALHRLEDG
jgi:hypothetical protein